MDRPANHLPMPARREADAGGPSRPTGRIARAAALAAAEPQLRVRCPSARPRRFRRARAPCIQQYHTHARTHARTHTHARSHARTLTRARAPGQAARPTWSTKIGFGGVSAESSAAAEESADGAIGSATSGPQGAVTSAPAQMRTASQAVVNGALLRCGAPSAGSSASLSSSSGSCHPVSPATTSNGQQATGNKQGATCSA